MTVQPVFQGVDIKYPEEQQVRERGLWENVKFGAGQGFNETSFSYTEDVKLLQESNAGLGRKVSKEEYENHINKIPGLAYNENMTEEILARANEAYYSNEQYNNQREKSTSMGVGALFFGQLAGSVPDPINLIPVPGTLLAKNIATRMIRTGGVNVLAETALAPMAAEAYKVRGQEYGIENYLQNAAFAFAVGGTLQASGEGLLGLVRQARSMGLMFKNPSLADQIVHRYDEALDIKIDFDPVTQKLINLKRVQVYDNTAARLENSNIMQPNKTTYVDNQGRIYDNANDVQGKSHIQFTPLNDGEIQVRGPLLTVLKNLSTIIKSQPAISDDFRFRIFDEMAPAEGRVINKADIDAFINEQVKIINQQNAPKTKIGKILTKIKDITFIPRSGFEPIPDPDMVLRTQDGKFEIHPDKATGKERLFERNTETGRLKEITGNEKEKIYKEVFEPQTQTRVTQTGPEAVTIGKAAQKTGDQINGEKTPDSVQSRQQVKDSLKLLNSDNAKDQSTSDFTKKIQESLESAPKELKTKILQIMKNAGLNDEQIGKIIKTDKDGRITLDQNEVNKSVTGSTLKYRFDIEMRKVLDRNDQIIKTLQERKAMVELDECKTKTGDKYMINDGGQ